MCVSVRESVCECVCVCGGGGSQLQVSSLHSPDYTDATLLLISTFTQRGMERATRRERGGESDREIGRAAGGERG